MSRPIDANRLIETLKKYEDNKGNLVCDYEEVIDKEPTILHMIKVAEWIDTDNCIFKCSNCGNDGENYILFNFCPECGAKMYNSLGRR